MDEYPFVLTTGARTYAFFHSGHRQMPRRRELNPDPIVEINPDDARKLNIAGGNGAAFGTCSAKRTAWFATVADEFERQWCRIWNMFGEARYKAHLTVSVKPGVIHAQHGWWFPEKDGSAPSLYETYRPNINDLIPNGHNGKLSFDAPFKCPICNIEGTTENHDTDMKAIQEKIGKLRQP